MLVVERGQGPKKLPKSVQNVPLRQVPAAEQAAAAVWVSNWLRMIPVINATRGTAPKILVKRVLNLVRRPLALSMVEHELSVGALARNEAIYLDRRFSDHAPLTIDYDFTL